MRSIEPLQHTTSSRRLRRLIVSWDLARDFIVAGQHDRRYLVIDGVPQDAALVNVRYAWPNCIELLLASASFDELKEGEEIPIINPTVELLSELFPASNDKSIKA